MQGFASWYRFFGLALVAFLANASGLAHATEHPDQLWIAQPQHLSAYATLSNEQRLTIPLSQVRRLSVDGQTGVAWAMTEEQLIALAPDGSPLSGPISLPVHWGAVVGLFPDHEYGNLWLVHDNGWIRFDQYGDFQAAWDSPEPVHDARLGVRDGKLLLLAENTLLEFAVDGTNTNSIVPLIHARHLIVDPATADIWLASDDTAQRYSANLVARDSALLLPLQPNHLQADGAGGLWLADEHRVMRLDRFGEPLVDIQPWFQQPDGGNAVIVALAAHAGEQSAWVANVQRFRKVHADGTMASPRDLPHPSALRATVLHADFTPPAIAILAPESETFTNNNLPTIELAYSDYGSAVATDSITLSWNGAPFVSECRADASSATCVPREELGDGHHHLAATVEDLAGNVSIPATVRFTIDTIPPTISVWSPEDDTYTREPAIEVRGGVSEMPVTLEIQDELTPVEYWTFRKDVSLIEGENRITLKATDPAGNSAWESLRVTLDTTPPPPPNGVTVVQDGDRIEIIGGPGSVDPYAQVDVIHRGASVDNQERNIWFDFLRVLIGVRADANGSFHIVLDEPGLDWRFLDVRVTDRAGNQSDPMPLPQPQPDRRNHPVGRLAGEFSVDPTGAANYRIPIDVPKGAAGMQPDLALLYSSRAGNGHLGVGWSLSGLSAVTRCPKTIAQDGISRGVVFDASDALCMDGQRLKQAGTDFFGNPEYVTEIATFQNIVAKGGSFGQTPTSFEVRDKAGLIRHYGSTADSRIRLQGKSTPLMWAISRIQDRNGNYIAFKYQQNNGASGNGEHYPIEVSWHNKHDDMIGKVVLQYENRPDKVEGFLTGGSRTALTKRLKTVRVYAGADSLARRYELEYEQAELSNHSVLKSAKLCGTGNQCLPATRFGWVEPTESEAKYTFISGNDDFAIADVNGDGAADIVYAHAGYYYIRYGGRLSDAVSTGVGVGPYGFRLYIDRVIVADIDGDGRQDLMVPHDDGTYWWLRGTETGLEIAKPKAVPTGNQPGSMLQRNNTALDLDGDGRTELLIKHHDRLKIVRYDGESFSEFEDAGIPIRNEQKIVPIEANGDGAPAIYITTGNCSTGDGGGGGGGGGGGHLPPIQEQSVSDPCDSSGVWRFSSTRFQRFTYDAPLAKHPVFIDSNGDGLTDILRKQGNQWFLYTNTGAGWEDSGFRGGDWDHERIRVLDWNGDGKQDLMFAGYKGDWDGPNEVWYVRVSTGTGFASKRNAGFNDGAHGDRYKSAQFIDLTGDGKPDLFYRDSENNHALIRPNGFSQALLTGVVDGYATETAIGYSLLGLMRNRYLGHTDEGLDQQDRGKLNIRNFVAPVPVVSFFAQDTGRVTATGKAVKVATSYKYKGAKVDVHGRGFLGFSEVHASNANTGISTVNHHKQSFPFAGTVWKTEQRLPRVAPPRDIDNDALRDDFFPPSCPGQQPKVATDCDLRPFTVNANIAYAEDTPGQLVSRSVSTLQTRKVGNAHFVWSSNTTEHQYDLDSGNVIRRIRSAYEYDDNGNVTNLDVRTDDGSGNDLHRVTTVNQYADNTSRWLLGRLSGSTVTHRAPGTPAITRRASFAYHPVTGQLESETLEPGDARLELTTTYTHDDFGNVHTRTVSSSASGEYAIAPRTTVTQYDQKGVYPESVTNALDHTETYAWDARFNAKRMSTGPNGLTTTWQFDSFGRVIKEIAPRTALYTTTERNWCGGGTPCKSDAAEIRIRTFSSTGAETITELDRLGREVLSYTRGLENEYIATETWYDLLGRTYLSSDPYRFDDPVLCYSFREYDTLNRVVAEHRPASAFECDRQSNLDIKRLYDHIKPPPRYSAITAFVYEGLTHTVTAPAGANGKQRKVRRTENVAGRLLSVTEWADDSTAIQTHYSYNATGETLSVTPPSGHAVTLQYDRRGRKTAMQDPDMGTWQYRHNALGELVWQQDAKGQTVTLEYDLLGRMIRRTEPEGTTIWTYDTAPGKGIGKIARIEQHDGYAEAFRYTPHGELLTHLKLIDGFAYFTHYNYDAHGRLLNLHYPAARDIPAAGANVSQPDLAGALVLTQHYSESGALKRVHRTDGDRNQLLWEAEQLSARGQLTRTRYGNHLRNHAQYDAANGLVTELGVGPEGNSNYTRQFRKYQWDTVGNLISREDVINDVLETFTYDRLSRLTRTTLAAGGYTANQRFEYDAAGNLKRKGNLRNYQYGEGSHGQTRPHAVIGIERHAGNNITETLTYLYDANGNVENANGRTITWSSDNKPLLIEKDGAYSRFQYGPDRARYKHEKRYLNGDKETTLYGGLTERLERTKNGTTTVEYRQHIQAGGQVIAVVTDYAATDIEKTNYFHRDHLGSIALITNANGKTIEETAFDAWGAITQQGRLTPNPWRLSADINRTTSRGFTGHEHLDHLGLIHMNGRVYDPESGRFLSADPFVQFPHSTQGYNRYSYLNNNPLNATDPSGYFSWKKVFGGVASSDLKQFAPTLIGIAVCAGTAGVGCAIAAGALSGAVGGYLATGSIDGALRGAALGAAAGAVMAGINAQFSGNTFSAIAKRAFSSGLVGGSMSKAGGGRFGDGFLGGMAGSLAASSGIANTGNRLQDMFVGAMAGGTVAYIGGGKFKNGAVSGAFAAAIGSMQRSRLAKGDISPDAGTIDAKERQQIFDQASAELAEAGHLEGHDVEFVNKFAVAKYDKQGRVLAVDASFETKADADAFLTPERMDAGWDHIAAVSSHGSTKHHVYAGGIGRTSIAWGVTPSRMKSYPTPLLGTKAVILHEIRHTYQSDEWSVNEWVKDQL